MSHKPKPTVLIYNLQKYLPIKICYCMIACRVEMDDTSSAQSVTEAKGIKRMQLQH